MIYSTIHKPRQRIFKPKLLNLNALLLLLRPPLTNNLRLWSGTDLGKNSLNSIPKVLSTAWEDRLQYSENSRNFPPILT
jgi:hypothetical protein